MILPLAYAQQLSSANPVTSPIKHIVVIMQENRSFDNYFGTYRGSNGIPKNICMPLDPDHPNNGRCVKPFLSTNPISEDIYDHVPPPQIDRYGLGPALIISPYAKQGYVDHTQYQFESVLKFIEWRFNIPALTNRDLHANDLLNAFNFNQNADSPYIVALNKTELNAIRPYMGLQKTVD